MNNQELAAIRQRTKETFTPVSGTSSFEHALRDRHTLLAEVDRLGELNVALMLNLRNCEERNRDRHICNSLCSGGMHFHNTGGPPHIYGEETL